MANLYPVSYYAPAGTNITFRMGDNAGVNKVAFQDLAGNERVSLDSDGIGALVGLNVNSADAGTGQFAIEGSTWPVLKLTRTTAVTGGTVSSFMLKTKSSGDMTDGFGGGMLFCVEDNAGTERLIGAIQAYRWASSDQSGLLTFRTYNVGALDDRLMITPVGNVLIMGDPGYERGPILQVKSGPGEHGIRGFDAVAGAQTVISNGAGDVLYILRVSWVIRDSAGNTNDGVTSLTPGNSANLYDDGGTNTCTIAVAANGSVTVQRTAGARTYKIMLDMIWL